MYVLLLEIYVDVLVPELPYIFEAVQGISCKSADGLGDDPVDLALHAVVDHDIELFTLFRVGAGNAIIGVYTCKLPFRVSCDVVGVVRNLGLITSGLLLAVGTYPAVGSNLELRLFFMSCDSVTSL